MAAPSPATEEVPPPAKPTKKPGFFSIVHAALFSPDVGKKPPGPADRGLWTNLICGIRPLHHPNLEDDEPVTPRPTPLPPAPARADSFHDVPMPPPSPGVHEGMCSRYASAEDLYMLDEDEEAEDGVGEMKGVRGSIDVKAEDFIAKFYEQMRLQRVDSMDKS